MSYIQSNYLSSVEQMGQGVGVVIEPHPEQVGQHTVHTPVLSHRVLGKFLFIVGHVPRDKDTVTGVILAFLIT